MASPCHRLFCFPPPIPMLQPCFDCHGKSSLHAASTTVTEQNPQKFEDEASADDEDEHDCEGMAVSEISRTAVQQRGGMCVE